MHNDLQKNNKIVFQSRKRKVNKIYIKHCYVLLGRIILQKQNKSLIRYNTIYKNVLYRIISIVSRLDHYKLYS